MNATAEAPEVAETMELRPSAAEQARIVCELLKEYATKLAELNGEMLKLPFGSFVPSTIPLSQLAPRAAWFLDRVDQLRRPLSKIISRGSALLEYSSPDAVAKLKAVAPVRENSSLDSLTADELALRMREIEIHHHHMLRLAHEIRQGLTEVKWSEPVKKLRLAAGLNAMKGGPLDPE